MLPINAIQCSLTVQPAQSTLSSDNHSLINQISHIQQTSESLNLNSSGVSAENKEMSQSEYLIILKNWRDDAPSNYIKAQRNQAIETLLQCHTNQDPCLILSNLDLQTLPILPPHITKLKLDRLGLIALPVLPSRLKILECVNNQLQSLPRLPPTLEKLDCSYNQFVFLPELPSSLIYFFASHNSLRVLPVPTHNLLPENIIAEHQTLPKKPRTLLDSISDWFINPSTHTAVQKFSTIKNDENTLAFSRFLDRLRLTKRVKNNIEAKEQICQ